MIKQQLPVWVGAEGRIVHVEHILRLNPDRQFLKVKIPAKALKLGADLCSAEMPCTSFHTTLLQFSASSEHELIMLGFHMPLEVFLSGGKSASWIGCCKLVDCQHTNICVSAK